MKENFLIIKDLHKTYDGKIKALNGINLTTKTGMFGLLGPNGAGKTTLMRIIATLLEPDKGEVFYNELNVLKNPIEFKKKLGYLPQEFGVYKNVSAYEMLEQFAILKGFTDKKERRKLLDYLFDRVNLFNDRKRKLGEYSGGMKQRFGIAIALLGNPEVLIVDEPTAGLDPGERKRFLNILSEIGKERIVILSTHIVDDIEELSDELAIINKGEIVTSGKVEELLKHLEGKVYVKQVNREELEKIKEEYKLLNATLRGGNIWVSVYSDKPLNEKWILKSPSLEEVYFYYIGGFQWEF
jgi:ABC-2 type transport system ATP-binding protein